MYANEKHNVYKNDHTKLSYYYEQKKKHLNKLLDHATKNKHTNLLYANIHTFVYCDI